MKRALLILAVLAIAFFVATVCLPEEIPPWGVGFSSNGNAFSVNGETKERTNLTEHVKGISVNGFFTLSENKKTLLFEQANKWWLMDLPNGKPYPAKWEALNRDTKDPTYNAKYFPAPQDTRKLCLCPDGANFAFETVDVDGAWTMTQPGTGKVPLVIGVPKQWYYNSRNNHPIVIPPLSVGNHNDYPMFVKQPDRYNSVKLCSTYSSVRGAVGLISFGNTAFYSPPALPCRTLNPGSTTGGSLNSLGPVILLLNCNEQPIFLNYLTYGVRGVPGLIYSMKDAYERLSNKRNAFFPCFAKTEQWKQKEWIFAVAYKRPADWVIEIRDFSEQKLGSTPQNPKKPGIIEAYLKIRSLDDMAFQPDGSLTFLTEGTLYSIDFSQIMEAFRQSRIEPSSDPKGLIDDSSLMVMANCAFIPAPKEVVRDINGDKIFWLSNSAFVFRGKDKAIYLWNNGATEKKFERSPEEFCFYRTILPIRSANLNVASAPNPALTPAKDDKSETGTGRAVEMNSNVAITGSTEFSIGQIRLKWHGHTEKAIIIATSVSDQKDLKFAMAPESNLEDIKDPRAYPYQYHQYREGIPPPTVNMGKIIMLELNGNYAALKPTGLERRYKTFQDMPKSMQNSWRKLGEKSPPIFEWMDYEWRYWPANNQASQTAEAAPVPVAQKPSTRSKSKARAIPKAKSGNRSAPSRANVGKDFSLGSFKVRWEEPTKETVNITADHLLMGSGQSLLVAHIKGKEIEDILDPYDLAYESTTPHDSSRQRAIRGNKATASCSIFVGFNEIAVFKAGGRYLAIKPIQVISGVLLYEHKFWQESARIAKR